MSLQYFEQRPPQVAAIKLDFLDQETDQVVVKLREVPGVYDVDVKYGDDGNRRFVVNPNMTKGRLEPDYWLVSIPRELRFDNELRMMSDEEFHAKYRVVMGPVWSGPTDHAVQVGNVEYR